MFERIKTALVLVAVVLSCMFATSSHYPMLALMLIAAAVGGYEWCKFMPKHQQQGTSIFTYCYAVGMLLIAGVTLYFRDIAFLLWCVAICIWLLSIYCIKNYPKFDGWYNKGLNAVGFVLICAAVTSIYYVWLNSPWWLMYLFLLVWGADSGAYFVGRKLGRRKMVPNVSPNKSIEGLIGGICTSVVIVMVVQLHYLHLSLRDHILFLLLSVITVLGSVLGDLFESMIKRRVGVKDSGTILPGHGGVLDRIDSLLAAAPIFAAGVYLLKLIGVDL
ncbi:hypothetical protein P256_00357 [Acinetobacter nectaris CIP 110549]|uniref:Phosphatidate cytidylyltransferase n=1 Tax=Acinetobacter nectaris CIP 110549 TaxID=1392540 RepID=V2V055_9GAMM|nr:phosphatidate cytidylyltransferase [Acinetobacter nectaris]ESK40929.1 hypothetical protein P256_00357 [Acinetobacter nectaris CIP 110549]